MTYRGEKRNMPAALQTRSIHEAESRTNKEVQGAGRSGGKGKGGACLEQREHGSHVDERLLGFAVHGAQEVERQAKLEQHGVDHDHVANRQLPAGAPPSRRQLTSANRKGRGKSASPGQRPTRSTHQQQQTVLWPRRPRSSARCRTRLRLLAGQDMDGALTKGMSV